jgi:hypothetical protein
MSDIGILMECHTPNVQKFSLVSMKFPSSIELLKLSVSNQDLYESQVSQN